MEALRLAIHSLHHHSMDCKSKIVMKTAPIFIKRLQRNNLNGFCAFLYFWKFFIVLLQKHVNTEQKTEYNVLLFWKECIDNEKNILRKTTSLLIDKLYNTYKQERSFWDFPVMSLVFLLIFPLGCQSNSYYLNNKCIEDMNNYNCYENTTVTDLNPENPVHILHCTKCILQNLPSNTFKENFNGLLEASLTESCIENLEEQVFDNLKVLEKLNLTRNKINVLPNKIFDSLHSLTSLDLSHNEIFETTVQFNNLYKLNTLNLNSNKITQISNTTFHDLHNLIELLLSNNAIVDLEPSIFLNTRLENLDLSQNPIVNLKENVFKGLNRLRKLNISNCHIRTIKKYYFTGLESLEYLSLRQNNIDIIENNSFVYLNTCMNLDLSSNELKVLEDVVFNGLTNLTSLKLHNNYIQTVGSNVFKNLTELLTLDLHKNNIERLPTNIFEGLRLIYLYLDNIHLKTNDLNFLLPLKNCLLELSVDANLLTDFKTLISELPKLEKLRKVYINNNANSSCIHSENYQSLAKFNIQLLFTHNVHVNCNISNDTIESITNSPIKKEEPKKLDEVMSEVCSYNAKILVIVSILLAIVLLVIFSALIWCLHRRFCKTGRNQDDLGFSEMYSTLFDDN